MTAMSPTYSINQTFFCQAFQALNPTQKSYCIVCRYALHLTVIESFKHKGLKKLYEKGDRSGLHSDIADEAELYLSILDTAQSLEKLDCKGFTLHRLTGNMKG
ncbi:MAG: hypothetical protein NPIRA01_33040 [Nitrospirales bacterium]|nr:MAG: hypothetical protein NPIRA01_33040 [Nitrospirales bacterium]